LLVVFALCSIGAASAEVKDYNAHQMSQCGKFLKMDLDHLNREDYLSTRKILLNLATANPDKTLQLTKSMLREVAIFKAKPETHFLFDKNVEFNLEVILSLLSVANGMPLSDVQLVDLRARFDGISDSLATAEQAAIAADVLVLLFSANDKISK
jgi:hypothetical protein